jgi:urease accessory protein
MSAVAMLLLADGRTPTGGYAHSGGLEAAGLRAEDVPAFLAARLATVGRVEAVAAVLAARARGTAELLTLEDEVAARTPSAAAREAARTLGLALLRTGRRLWPSDELLRAYAGEAVTAARPVALGVVAAAGGLVGVAVARLALYDDAATVASAAPKLLSVDAADAAAWLAALGPAIEARAAEAAAQAVLGTLPATATPLLDLRAERHLHDTRRLFAS